MAASGKLTVVGPGALGTALADSALRKGWQVRALGRGGPLPVDITFSSPDGTGRLVLPAPTPEDLRDADLVLVTVKAFDLRASLKHLACLRSGTPVLIIANGWIDAELQAAVREYPQLLIRQGVATLGVSERDGGGFDLRSSAGSVEFGPVANGTGRGAAVAAGDPTAAEQSLCQPAGGLFRWQPEIRTVARYKWLNNTVINTLCAHRRLATNGELLGDIPTLAAVFSEAWNLGAESFGPWTLPRDTVWQNLLKLIERTRANENSMARDRRLGRPTESAWLAGLARDSTRYPMLTRMHGELAAGLP